MKLKNYGIKQQVKSDERDISKLELEENIMSMVRLNSNNYICTYKNVIEIKANSLDEAIEKAKTYYKNKYHESIKDKEVEIMDVVGEEETIDFFMSWYVKKIPSIIGVLEQDGRNIMNEKIDWIDMIIKSLPALPSKDIWTDGDKEILVKTESSANTIASLIEWLYKMQNKEILINMGYYDPEEDKRNNEEDEYTGWWYVNIE